jgi:hypothetical protein
MEHQGDAPKVTLWYGMMKDRVIGLIFFQEAIATRHLSLGILEQRSAPQLHFDAWFQHGGTPPHFGNISVSF